MAATGTVKPTHVRRIAPGGYTLGRLWKLNRASSTANGAAIHYLELRSNRSGEGMSPEGLGRSRSVTIVRWTSHFAKANRSANEDGLRAGISIG